jgi:Asp-tRNA(Asn)/Glu-tRNA(Gln) amidotransferase A subunit family amidase
MNQSDYLAQDAVGLAGLISSGQVTATEVVKAALARLEAVNPKLNAVTLQLGETALASVKDGAPTGPLAGVPYLIKDLGAQVAGTPTTAGSWLMGDSPAAADSAIVSAYRRGGLVIIGKTNTPEFGLEPVTEPARFGPARNPWNLERTPGGSSGGASAAVAGGVVPAAHASDGGGSIRIPAACSGLFGLKPSRGRVSFAPADEGWGGFSIQHAVTWSVRDSAALLDLVCQPVPGDPYWRDAPATPFSKEVGRDPGSLRIAFTTRALVAPAIDPQCAEAVLETARLCESLGHRVEEAELPGDFAAAGQSGGVVIAANVAATLDAEVARRGRPLREDEVEDVTWAMYQRGRRVSGSDYIHALQACHAFGRVVGNYFQDHDVLLLSTLGSPAVPVGWLREGGLNGYADRLFAFMPNTQAFNITGQPAMSVPLAMSADGLPTGLQFVARVGDEATLFRLAAQLERARPWAGRRPSL